MIYPILRDALFLLPPERAHHLALQSLSTLSPIASMLRAWGGIALTTNTTPTPFGKLILPNPCGLAAGLDKNGECIEGLLSLGFGFIEIGTVTPKAQAGNPLPRLFRLPEYRAMINRMGFNNEGVLPLTERVANHRAKMASLGLTTGMIGINIGKNATTPIENAVDDYLFGLKAAQRLADYITINISSPNTSGLRSLQGREALKNLLEPLKEEQILQNQARGKEVPLLVKIAPDLSTEELSEMCEVFQVLNIEGVIATNTTLSRMGVEYHIHAKETGGLSGAPLKHRATDVIRTIRSIMPTMPIMGVGGIETGEDALAKKAAGANAVQVYTGFIYKGPALIHDIVKKWN